VFESFKICPWFMSLSTGWGKFIYIVLNSCPCERLMGLFWKIIALYLPLLEFFPQQIVLPLQLYNGNLINLLN